MPASRPMSNCRTDSATCSCIPTGAANQSAGAGQPFDKCGEGSTPSSARARCLMAFSIKGLESRVDGGIVQRPQVAMLCPWRRRNSPPGLVSAGDPYLREALFQLTGQAIDVHQNGRVAEIWTGLRHRADADNPCTASAPRRSTYPKAGASMREKHLIDVLIAEILPVVAAHALFCHSEFAPV